MQEYLEGTGKPLYRAVYMKRKLQEHFGEKIMIITVNNWNVLTFCSTVATIISEFYKQPRVDDYEVEQTRIVAGLKKVWIRYNIRDSARRSQQGLNFYSPNVSLLLLQPLSTTTSGSTARYSSGECCDPATRRGVWNYQMEDSNRKNWPTSNTRLCQRLLGAMVTLTVAPRDVPAKNMEWIAQLHVVPVESEIVARILPHQTSVKTMKKHQ